MRILLVTLPSLHFMRWIENLRDTQHELFCFDITQCKYPNQCIDIRIVDWQKNIIPFYKGEYINPTQLGWVYERVQNFMETKKDDYWDRIIEEIKPDIVHSFEMQTCVYPIANTMRKHGEIYWIYSCWGSDMFYYQQFPEHLSKIKEMLLHIHCLHADCLRDLELATQLGFRGKFADIIPGGGGYAIVNYNEKRLSINDRNIILVKGYENTVGRALNVIKALENLGKKIENYQVIVFCAYKEVSEYIDQRKLPFHVWEGFCLNISSVLELMGKSLIYIGNSTSDGMPNTLLEAIIMGAFPIQSNPGSVTEEIIENGINGLLINNTEDIEALQELIEDAINNKERLQAAQEINMRIAEERLDFAINRQKIISMYENPLILD